MFSREDSIVSAYLSGMPNVTQLVVENGSGDGVLNSVSRYFIQKGWSSILLEYNGALYKKLKEGYGPVTRVECLNSGQLKTIIKQRKIKNIGILVALSLEEARDIIKIANVDVVIVRSQKPRKPEIRNYSLYVALDNSVIYVKDRK